jgi:hypothetical protein
MPGTTIAADRSPSPSTSSPCGCRPRWVEASTLAAYRSYLDKHFLPTFGEIAMGKLRPSHVWPCSSRMTPVWAARGIIRWAEGPQGLQLQLDVRLWVR